MDRQPNPGRLINSTIVPTGSLVVCLAPFESESQSWQVTT
jgi:hypothetical protein